MNGYAHDSDPRPSLSPSAHAVISAMAHYKSEISHFNFYFTSQRDCQEIMAYPDINDPGISNEIRTDAPLISHGSERNKTVVFDQGIKKILTSIFFCDRRIKTVFQISHITEKQFRGDSMEENLTPSVIDITNINEKVYDYIKKNITTSSFPSGYKLNIKQLSETLGVSHTPIKDALFRLAGEGLIDITSRTGTYVTSITEADIHEILQTRLILETAVIEEITEKITDEQLQTLKDLYRKSISIAVTPNDSESYKAFMEYDSQFHLSFFNIMGNNRLLHIYMNLNAHMQMVRFRLMSRVLGKQQTTDEEHRMILEALCERNVAKAKQAIANHLHRMDTVFATAQQDQGNPGRKIEIYSERFK
ncbi:MAG: GntR family transcriptional regulator [Deltaproteobacteria bacterium]|nr:GntR family transcriptional regulator [Deltaproteobacteria bacterium]